MNNTVTDYKAYVKWQQAIKILKELEKVTDIDYCGLYENEILNIIYRSLKHEV